MTSEVIARRISDVTLTFVQSHAEIDMKTWYLLLAVVGTIGPYVFFTPWFAEMGLSPAAFVMGGFANGVAGGFTVDVIVSSIAFWVWLGAERAPRAWLYMLLNLTIGLSCALPLYLYFREARAAQPSAAYSG